MRACFLIIENSMKNQRKKKREASGDDGIGPPGFPSTRDLRRAEDFLDLLQKVAGRNGFGNEGMVVAEEAF